ncbi:MAG: glycosyltransferase [Candidatus Methylomirabilia bacterium]
MPGSEPRPRPIKVLHLLAALGVGGTERISVDLIRSLDREKVESTVCLYHHRGELAGELTAAGYPVIFLEKAVLSNKLPGALAFLSYPVIAVESVIFVRRLAGMIARSQTDILHARLFSANLWGRLAGKLAGVGGIITTEESLYKKLSLKNAVLGRLLAGLGDRVVAISKDVGKAAERQQHLPPGKVVVIPNGIRLERVLAEIAAGSRERPVSPSSAGPTIACLGRLAPEKRQDILLRAVKICLESFPQLRCWIIGEGPEEERLRRLAADLGLAAHVEFLGEQFEVGRFFPSIDVMVNSSEREGLPISLIEAMAGGVPVVATAVGGTGEIVRDGETGILVPPEDPRALAEGIGRLLADRPLAQRLAAEARALVLRRHTLSAVARVYERLYQEILAEKAARKNL